MTETVRYTIDPSKYKGEKTPCTNSMEREAIETIAHLVTMLDPNLELTSRLYARAKAAGCLSQLKGGLGILKNALDKMCGSLPEERFDQILFEINHTYLKTVPVGKARLVEEGVVVLSESDVKAIGEALQKAFCSLCEGGTEELRRCPYRRWVQKIMFVDSKEQEKQYGQCIGALMRWNE